MQADVDVVAVNLVALVEFRSMSLVEHPGHQVPR